MVALADEVVEVSDKGTVLSKKGWEGISRPENLDSSRIAVPPNGRAVGPGERS